MNIQDTEIAHAVPQKKDNEVCSFGQFLVRSPMRSIAVAVCPNVIPKPQGLALSGLHHDARDIRDTAQEGNSGLQDFKRLHETSGDFKRLPRLHG